MNLEGTVSDIIKDNPRFKKAIKEKPEVKDKLSEIVGKYYDDYSSLISWAKFGDKVNRLLGPLESGIKYFSTLGGIGWSVYGWTKLLHYGLIKLPYLAYYTAKTGDVKGALTQGAAEIAKYVTPWGQVADIYPLYEKSLKKYITDNATKSLDDYLATVDLEPRERKLGVIQDNIRVPLELVRDYQAKIASGKLYLNAPGAGYELKFRPLGDGVQEVYVLRKPGVHPSVYTTMVMPLPKDTVELKLPEDGLLGSLGKVVDAWKWMKDSSMGGPKPRPAPEHVMRSRAA